MKDTFLILSCMSIMALTCLALVMKRIRKDTEELRGRAVELAIALDAAEAASRAKTRFLNNMSHELRTPLNAIVGFSNMLKEDAEESGDGESAEILGSIESAGDQLNDLIATILDVSKFETGSMEISVSEFDLHQAVNSVAKSFTSQTDERGNRLEFTCPEDIGRMVSDEAKLQRCLRKLLGNAFKFTEKGVITLAVSSEKGTVKFSVSDTGIGMTREQLETAFLPFTQADESSTRRYEGAGLGLAVTKCICELLHGSIEAQSEESEGSTFTITLPRTMPATAGTEDEG